MTKLKNRCLDESKKDGLDFPVVPYLSETGKSFFNMRDSVIKHIKESRLRLVLQANSGMIMLSWNIGNEILQRRKIEDWGARVIDRHSKD